MSQEVNVVSFFVFKEGTTDEQIQDLWTKLYSENEHIIKSAEHNEMKNKKVFLEAYRKFRKEND